MASLRQPDRAAWDQLLADVPPEDLVRAGIRRDEATGAPYTESGGRRNYISPAAWRRVRAEDMPADGSVPANPYVPADTTGIFRQAPKWNQRTGKWETPIDWGNIVTLATAGGLTAGVANAAMAGAPAAGGGSAASTALPTATPITSAGMATAMPGSMVGAPALAGAGGAAGTAGTAAGTGGATGALKKIGGSVAGSNGMDFSEMLKLALLQGGLGTLSGLLGKDEPQRQSFKGTSADPVNMLTEAQNSIRGFKEPLMTRLRTPVTIPGASAPPNAFGIRGSVPDIQANRGESLDRARTLMDLATKIGKR